MSAARIAASSDAGDLSGSLELFPLANVLQFLAMNQLSGEISLGEQSDLVLHVGDGLIHAAACGHLTGVEAALAILGHRTGSFKFKRAVPSTRRDLDLIDLNTLLMERVRLEDELERRSSFATPLHAKLHSLHDELSEIADDPLDCGLPQVSSYLKKPAPLSQLLQEIPLCDLKIKLAVRSMLELKLVRVSTGASSTSLRATRPADASPLSSFLEQRRGIVRVLCSVDAEAPSGQVEFALSRLAHELNAELPRITLVDKGPTFVRLRPRTGGVVSLTLLSLTRPNRVLFQSFVSSTDVVLMPEGREDTEAVAWRGAILSQIRCGFYSTSGSAETSLSAQFMRQISPLHRETHDQSC